MLPWLSHFWLSPLFGAFRNRNIAWVCLDSAGHVVDSASICTRRKCHGRAWPIGTGIHAPTPPLSHSVVCGFFLERVPVGLVVYQFAHHCPYLSACLHSEFGPAFLVSACLHSGFDPGFEWHGSSSIACHFVILLPAVSASSEL